MSKHLLFQATNHSYSSGDYQERGPVSKQLLFSALVIYKVIEAAKRENQLQAIIIFFLLVTYTVVEATEIVDQLQAIVIFHWQLTCPA